MADEALRQHAIEGARLALLAELYPQLPAGLSTPLGQIEVHAFRRAMGHAIEAYDSVMRDSNDRKRDG